MSILHKQNTPQVVIFMVIYDLFPVIFASRNFHQRPCIIRNNVRYCSEQNIDIVPYAFEIRKYRLAETALHQINNRQYDMEMQAQGVREILKYGIAFSGKDVCVKAETVTNSGL